MEILLVSNNDTCRSRMAQEILNSFGRGMRIFTAGVLTGNGVPDAVCTVMEQNGYDLMRRKPCDVGAFSRQSWDYVITLCRETEEELKAMNLNVTKYTRFYFEDPFKKAFQDESEQEQEVTTLYESMHRQLYEFYRDELSEQLMPRCTCGANTYCRCE